MLKLKMIYRFERKKQGNKKSLVVCILSSIKYIKLGKVSCVYVFGQCIYSNINGQSKLF